ncbi:permease [Clostridium sp. PL3]|uniref:Permease n=2 Tax=Clostridium thailandense TaxID=2794346 RepID=A0A949X659_9CLOT|nr:permease [Clostridium thailandense]
MAKNFIIITICIPFLTILFLSIPLLMSTLHFSLPQVRFKFLTENSILQEFSIIFLSIILEAFPFIMVGTILSSIIQIFITEEALSRIIPRNRFLGLLCASLIGLIVPICDCGHAHHNSNKKYDIKSTIIDIIKHTNIKLHDVGRYLIIGSFLSAIMQTFISRRYILLESSKFYKLFTQN